MVCPPFSNPPLDPSSHAHDVVKSSDATEDAKSTAISETKSLFFLLPMELRLQIYDHMNLSPFSEGADDWTGLYFSCQQIMAEMRKHLKPERGVGEHLVSEGRRWPKLYGPVCIQPHSHFDILTQVSVTLAMDHLHRRRRIENPIVDLKHLCKLYIDRLVFQISGTPKDEWGDLKSFPRAWFADYVRKQQINCKTLTFTLTDMVDAEGGRSKSTSLENTFKDEGMLIPYTLTIVQDGEENHVEKTYHSATRFRPV